MISKNSRNINKDGIQINGDGDNSFIQKYFMLNGDNPITHTDIYELLEIINGLKIDSHEEFNLNVPAELNVKLTYNNATVYKELFENYAVQLIPIEDVMGDFPNSSKIIMKLHRLFIEQANRDKNGEYIVGNGDRQLEMIENQLKYLIKCDIRFIEAPLSDETLEAFIIGLLAYGVAKCKILINPIK